MEEHYLSIDLGGTKCAGAIISGVGKIEVRSKKMIAGMKGIDVVEAIIELTNEIVKEGGFDANDLNGIGISVPGIVYKEDGTVWAPNIPGWDRFPLKEMILSNLPGIGTMSIDNDRACSIMGEHWLGAAQNCSNAIYLAFGTGIGAGILTDGRVLRGQSDIAGSIGWMVIDNKYPEDYKKFGCFEYNASGDGLQRLAAGLQSSLKSDKKSRFPYEEMNATTIMAAYQEDDPLALEVINIAIQYWGKGVANLVSMFNPEKIIFGGGLFGPGLQFLDQIYREAKKYAQPIAINQVELCAGDLEYEAQLYGAVKILMNEIQ